MQFLKVSSTARGASLGDAYSVWASGADAVFWNPGGVALTETHEFTFSYVRWIFETKQLSFSYAASLGDFGAAGVQIQYVDFGEMLEAVAVRPYINTWPDPGLTGNTFRPYSILMGVTYGMKMTDKFSAGGSLKFAHESLYNGGRVFAQVSSGASEEVKTWADGVMFDFGLRYETGFRSVAIGASVQNFGANVTYAKESHPLPMMFRWGIAGNLLGDDALFGIDETNRIGLAFELFQPNDYSQQVHVGAEYEYGKIFSVRAGYKFNYDSESFTFGAGLKQVMSSVRVTVDYAYGSLGEYLGSVHRISVGAGI